MPQDKASQFKAVGMIYSPSKVDTISTQDAYCCNRCGALVLEDSRKQHLAWHLLIRADFLNMAPWADPGEV